MNLKQRCLPEFRVEIKARNKVDLKALNCNIRRMFLINRQTNGYFIHASNEKIEMAFQNVSALAWKITHFVH